MLLRSSFRCIINRNSPIYPKYIVLRASHTTLPPKIPDSDKITKATLYAQYQQSLTNLYSDMRKSINDYSSDMTQILEQMEKKNYNIRNIKIGVGAALAIVIIASYDLIRNWLGEQASEITTKSLEDPEVKIKALSFCEDIIEELGKNQKVRETLSNVGSTLISDLAKRDDIKQSLADLFYQIFISNTIVSAGGKLSADVVIMLLQSPEYEWLRNDIYKYIYSQIDQLSNDTSVHEQLSDAALKTLSTTLSAMIWRKKSVKKTEITS